MLRGYYDGQPLRFDPVLASTYSRSRRTLVLGSWLPLSLSGNAHPILRSMIYPLKHRQRKFWYSLQGVLSDALQVAWYAAEQVSERSLILSMSEAMCVTLGFSDGNTKSFF
jgi:hypothetical protein